MPTLGALTAMVATHYQTASHTVYSQTDSVDVGTAAVNLNIAVSAEPAGVGGSAAGYVDYYLVEADAAAATFNAGASGTSGPWTASGTTEADQIKNARFIGRLAVNGTDTSRYAGKFTVVGPFQQFVAVVTYNFIGTANTNANSNAYIKYQTVTY